ncbi:MAG: hypothetical protein KQ78_01734 [Candidatus Izimaplasma bacterium HR2]|nr:MAG: hypothetical protein KQ78_01734 [Candidatus Izimaplasma bacterium HR2]
MLRFFKIFVKILLIFFAFYFVLNLAEYIFNVELDSYTIVIFFIVVASSTGIFDRKSRKW